VLLFELSGSRNDVGCTMREQALESKACCMKDVEKQ